MFNVNLAAHRRWWSCRPRRWGCRGCRRSRARESSGSWTGGEACEFASASSVCHVAPTPIHATKTHSHAMPIHMHMLARRAARHVLSLTQLTAIAQCVTERGRKRAKAPRWHFLHRRLVFPPMSEPLSSATSRSPGSSSEQDAHGEYVQHVIWHALTAPCVQTGWLCSTLQPSRIAVPKSARRAAPLSRIV